MRHLLFLSLLVLVSGSVLRSQEKIPAVIVGIVVENMRPDYLQRFESRFGDEGFLKLRNGGWNCTDVTMDLLVQNHATGTATLFTGASPSRHGIVDISWYDRTKAAEIHCVTDEKYFTAGVPVQTPGASPAQLVTITLADQLKMHTNGKGKVFSIAMNSTPAVLSAGFSPDGVYWFDDLTGNMVTSSYYRKELPEWVVRFNGEKPVRSFASRNWALLRPVNEYRECSVDNDSLESGFGPGWNTFPYKLEDLIKTKGNYGILKATPFANSLLKSFFLSMMETEDIGKDQVPDLVTLFFSSMDIYSGEFGPSSMETEDLYLRLDQEIAEIVRYLENKFGKDRFMLFLTANTSSSYPVKILKERYRIPSGYFYPESAHALLNTYLHATFGDLRWTEFVSSSQVYLNMRLTGINNVKSSEILDKSAEFLSRFEGIRLAVTSDMIRQNILPAYLSTTIIRSYSPGRSGDILFQLRDGWQPLRNKMKVPYTDQQKLPLLFYGTGIIPGTDRTPHLATDLVPTLSAILGIQAPVSGEGKAIDLLRGVKQ
jgi:hypothetical protein